MTNSTRISVETSIGFADARVIRLEKANDKLVVVVRTWNDVTVEVSFLGVIGFRESMSCEISDLVMSECLGEFGELCRKRAYEGDATGAEIVYEFLDVDERVAVEVIAKGIRIHAN